MKKKIVSRMANSFAWSVAVSQMCMLIVTAVVVHTTGDSGTIPLVPDFAAHFSNPSYGLIVQSLLCGVIGLTFGGCSVIMEFERWSMVKQGVIHFLITASVWVPISGFCWGLFKYASAFCSTMISLMITYAIIWGMRIRQSRKEIAEINRELERRELEKQEEEYAIEIQNLRKSFGSKCAVNGISLSVVKGELLSLLGVNGAGKTTTIRMLTGLSKPSAGEAFVYGYSITKELGRVKELVNLSPQETAVAPNLTVYENLQLMAVIYGSDKTKMKERVEKIISDFSLEEVRCRKAKLLSGGWQRRLSIAMALITEPKVLFLDEPTLGLDVLARRELWKAIEKLKGQITIILTTHYMEEAESLSDRIAVMVDGNIRAYGTLEELKARTGKTNLEDAFVKIAEEEVR